MMYLEFNLGEDRQFLIEKYQGISRIAWKLKGNFHKENGPAIIYLSDSFHHVHYMWMVLGKKHRDNGPAAIFYDGYESWFYFGKWCWGKKEYYIVKWFSEIKEIGFDFIYEE